MRSRVTTKRGDKGSTVTLGGDALSKSDPVIECCGQLDALRAHTALCRLLVLESGRGDADELGRVLFRILHVYFLIGTECNDPLRKHPEYRKGEVSEHHLSALENHQEKLESGMQLPKAFIVSAANPLAAQMDIACTIARTLERSIVRLREAEPTFESTQLLAYVNRLSDYFYVLARHLEDGKHIAVDYEVLQDDSQG